MGGSRRGRGVFSLGTVAASGVYSAASFDGREWVLVTAALGATAYIGASSALAVFGFRAHRS